MSAGRRRFLAAVAGAGCLGIAGRSSPGGSSNALGSRVLDGGFAVDVDADGRPELVVTDDARTSLVVIPRTKDGATTTARPGGGRVTSNLHAVSTAAGLQVGAGTGAVSGCGGRPDVHRQGEDERKEHHEHRQE